MKKEIEKPNRTTASEIMALLCSRYDEYHRTGEFQMGRANRRIDLLAIRCSFSNPEIHGFEVKVSRSDFTRDDKWPEYLEPTKQLWFVTAAGIADKDEIPEQCGWLEASVNAKKLFMRKKAPLREMQPDAEANLFRRLVHREYYGSRRYGTRESLEAWVKDAKERKGLSHAVNRKIQNAFNEQENRIRQQEKTLLNLQCATDLFASKGIDPSRIMRCDQRLMEHLLRARAPELFNDDTEQTLKQIMRAGRHLEEAARQMGGMIRTGAQTALDSLKLEEADEG